MRKIALYHNWKQLITVLGLGLLLSCATSNNSVAEERKLEPLYGINMDKSAIYAQVYSGGCTSRESFHLEIKANKEGGSEIAIYRIKPDYCKALVRGGVEVSFPIKKDSINAAKPVVIKNTFTASPFSKKEAATIK